MESFKKNRRLKINDKNIGILAIALFLISPLLSLPTIILSLYNKEKVGLFSLALFGGILSYAILPTKDLDLSRYCIIYEKILTGGFNGLESVLKESNDYLFFFIYYLFSLFQIPFQLMLFILAFLSYYSCLYIFHQIISQFKVSKKEYLFFLIAFVFSLPILAQVSVTRYSIGFIFFMWFTYFWYTKKVKWAIIAIVLAFLTHFAYVIYIPFVILFLFVKNKKMINGLLFILAICSFGLSFSSVLMRYLQYLPLISQKALTYTELYAETTIPILSYSFLSIVFIVLVFYLLYNRYINIQLTQIFLTITIVVLITIPFNFIIYDRFIQVFKPISVLILTYACLNNNATLVKKAKMRFFILFLYPSLAFYYVYTFIAIYNKNYQGFFSLGKFLFMSIIGTTYTADDIH